MNKSTTKIKHGGSRPATRPDDKRKAANGAKTARTVKLNDKQMEYIRDKYTGLTDAVNSLLPVGLR